MLKERLGRFYERAGRINNVVHNERRPAGHVANQVHHFAYVHVNPPLIDDRQRCINLFCEVARPLHSACVGRNDRHRPQLLLLKILHQNRRREQVVHRDIEVSLNLRRVQIERKYAARSRRFQQIRHQLCRNRHAWPVFSVLPRVRVIRNHRSNAPGRRALKCVDHQQQLHQVEIHRTAARLYDEHIRAAHIL